jgi:hypothetical protein
MLALSLLESMRSLCMARFLSLCGIAWAVPSRQTPTNIVCCPWIFAMLGQVKCWSNWRAMTEYPSKKTFFLVTQAELSYLSRGCIWMILMPQYQRSIRLETDSSWSVPAKSHPKQNEQTVKVSGTGKEFLIASEPHGRRRRCLRGAARST